LLERFMRVGLLRTVISALLFVSAILSSARVSAQSAPAAAAPVRPACAVDSTKPTDADNALRLREYAEAERLYGEALAADPTSSAAMAGLVRTTLAEGKLPEALVLALKDIAAHPNDPVLLDALGEVRFRRGEVDEAATAFNQASQLDHCNGRTHYDMAQFLNLSGMYASAQRQLDLAHALAPLDPEIARRWQNTHAAPATSEQMLDALKRQLDLPALTEQRKGAINAAIAGIESNAKGNCELVTPVAEAKVPIVAISSVALREAMYEAALDVQLNGKKKRLEIDTGAAGLVLTSVGAKSAGLTPESTVKTFGVGDEGAASSYVTHVDDIRIGEMEFKNCRVEVLEPGNAIEKDADVDGIIGPDVFRNYVVTLDFPSRQLRLGALPVRPGDQPATTSLLANPSRATPASAYQGSATLRPDHKNRPAKQVRGTTLVEPTFK
jgi:tetratricopeptide (TPR) repeat protein